MNYTTDASTSPAALAAQEGRVTETQTLYQAPDQRHKRGRRFESAAVPNLLVLTKQASEQNQQGIGAWTGLLHARLTDALGPTHLSCSNTHKVCKHPDIVVFEQVLRSHLGEQTNPVAE